MIGQNLTIIIPFYNGHKTIGRLLDSIPDEIPTLVIDDVSDKPYKMVDKPNHNYLRLQEKGYFTGACNAGIMMTDTDVLIVNQDAYFTSNAWMDIIDQDYDMIGERILGNHPAWKDGYIHGTFLFARREAINKVGMMNARLYPLWGSTCEWQLRFARKGMSILPVERIPGFKHEREGRFGSSIQDILLKEPNKRNLFIRTPPEISIIVSCYNYGRFLPDLINSLIGGETSLGFMPGQTMQSFEIIIVDDASTDDSNEIIHSLISNKKGIRAVKLDRNSGTAAAHNAGIANSYGRYIAILGADDMMETRRLEILYKAAVANPHSMIYDNVMPFGHGKRMPEMKIRVRGYDFETLLYQNHIHAGILVPRQAINEVGGYPEIMNDGREDWAINVALGAKGWCGVYVPERLYLYRREEHNRTLRNTTKTHRALFLEKLKFLFPNLYEGERPPMCCGGGRAVQPVQPFRQPRIPVAGGANMSLLEYVGTNWGTQTFYGPITGARYQAGLSAKVVDVDQRDLNGSRSKSGLLDIAIDGKLVFKVYTPSKPVAPHTPVVEVIKDEDDQLLLIIPEEAEKEEIVVKEKPKGRSGKSKPVVNAPTDTELL